MRAHITCPFIIIRASAVRNDKLRLASQSEIDIVSSPGRSLSPSPSPDNAPGRKVAIAYRSYSVGVHLMELAKQLVLLPQDEIFVVHCFSGEKYNNVMKQTKSILMRTITLGLADSSSHGSAAAAAATSADASGPADELDRQMTLGRKASLDEVTEEDSLEFGAKELAGWEKEKLHLGVVLRGDPRTALTTFCESEGIELLVISTRIAGFIRKTLTGGSVSGYLIDKAPCPCLVAPLKSLNIGGEEEEGPGGDHVEWASNVVSDGGERDTGGDGTVGTLRENLSSPPQQGFLNVEALQAQLAEKDKLIEVLRDEVARLRLAAAENSINGAGGA